MKEQEDSVIYTREQFVNILELLINANKVMATKFMIDKLQEMGFYVLEKDKISSRIELLKVMEEVHSKNPDLDEEEVMSDILNVQRELRISRK